MDRLTVLSGVEGLKINRNSHSKFAIGLLKTNEIKLRSAATSLFDVRCSVCFKSIFHHSIFKAITHPSENTHSFRKLYNFGDVN